MAGKTWQTRTSYKDTRRKQVMLAVHNSLKVFNERNNERISILNFPAKHERKAN